MTDFFELPPPDAPVSLREITASTVRRITDDLQLADTQTSYVANNAVSLAQALFHPEAWYRAIVAGDVPVGFVMVADETLMTPAQRRAACDAAGEAMPDAPQFGLWRLMVDRRLQGRGYGRAAMALLAAHARTRPGVTALDLSYVPGSHEPRAFYEKLGFVATGEVDDGEIVMRLDLARRDGPLGAEAAPARAAGSPASAVSDVGAAMASASAAASARTADAGAASATAVDVEIEPAASVAAPAAALPPAPGTPPTAAALALAAQVLRHIDEVPLQRQVREPLYDTVCARLAVDTAARKLGASVDTLAPGKRGCPYHLHHMQEEMFVVLQGEGHLRVAGEWLPLRAGHVVFAPPGPEFPHQIVNSGDAPLRYVSISTRETPEICVYPDSDKFSTWASQPGRIVFSQNGRMGPKLDYWDGEP